MKSFEDYFDRIICINRDCRTDRWARVTYQCEKFGLRKLERFTAHEKFNDDGTLHGNDGCTSSHRGLLAIAAYLKQRILVLEDDFEIVEPGRYEWDHNHYRLPFHDQWAAMVDEIPNDYDILYLGGQYARNPIRRLSPHMILTDGVLCATAYTVNWRFAQKIVPYIIGGAADTHFSNLHDFFSDAKLVMVQPRLFIQSVSVSDLCGNPNPVNNGMCMLDPNHERLV